MMPATTVTTSTGIDIESALKSVIGNPDAVIKIGAIIAVHFIIGIAFGYSAYKSMKHIIEFIGLTLLLALITVAVMPTAVSVASVRQAISILMPILTLSTAPFLAGIIAGWVIGWILR